MRDSVLLRGTTTSPDLPACYAQLVEAAHLEAILMSPRTGKPVYGYYGAALDRGTIETCAREMPFVAHVESTGDVSTIETSDGKRFQLWFAAPAWVVGGAADEIAVLRQGPRLAADGPLGRLIATLPDCDACAAMTYPVADRIIGVSGAGLSFGAKRGSSLAVQITLAYPTSAAAASAAERLRTKQLDPAIPDDVATALATTATRVKETSVALSLDFSKPPWSGLDLERLVALTAALQARLADDPTFPGLR
jgi:hypothetical protein